MNKLYFKNSSKIGMLSFCADYLWLWQSTICFVVHRLSRPIDNIGTWQIWPMNLNWKTPLVWTIFFTEYNWTLQKQGFLLSNKESIYDFGHFLMSYWKKKIVYFSASTNCFLHWTTFQRMYLTNFKTIPKSVPCNVMEHLYNKSYP